MGRRVLFVLFSGAYFLGLGPFIGGLPFNLLFPIGAYVFAYLYGGAPALLAGLIFGAFCAKNPRIIAEPQKRILFAAMSGAAATTVCGAALFLLTPLGKGFFDLYSTAFGLSAEHSPNRHVVHLIPASWIASFLVATMATALMPLGAIAGGLCGWLFPHTLALRLIAKADDA
jgi:hypothetical protein